MTPSPHDLSETWKAALLCAFGISTSLVIVALAELGARPFDLLLLAASLGALVTAGLWLWILATRRSLGWGVAFGLALLVPYVNFVVASIYARRYWSEGGRAPALLALLAIAVQTVASFRVFQPFVSPPV
ncbi:MAG: hypothetical protein WEF50_01115 [Myxococcota bacterium]